MVNIPGGLAAYSFQDKKPSIKADYKLLSAISY
jgi:hypothetical protein